MKFLNLIILSFLTVSSACSKGLIEENDNTGSAVKGDLKVMTYNIHHCNPPSEPEKIDMQAVANIIKNAGPDLVALQEVDVFTERSGTTLDQANELGRLTGMYSYFVKAIDYRGGAYGVAILSKYPFINSTGYLLPMKAGVSGEQRALATATVELPNGKQVIFGSTHFDIKEHRLIQAEKVHQVFKNERLPVVFAGDFNEGPGSPSISYLDQYYARTCGQTCRPTAPATNPTQTIDLIFVKPEIFQVLSTQVLPDSYASDHRAVVSTLKFK